MPFSITGLIMAIIFIAVSLYVLSRKTDGQGGALQLILTFPWFFIAMDKIPLWLGIVPNAIITYFVGSWIEWLIKNLIMCIL